MTITEIRPLEGEDRLEVLYHFQNYAFRASPPFRDKEEWMKIVRERKGVTHHVLFEDDKPVSGAASTVMTQNVRGMLYPAGGVWGVVTLPEARRKGYARQVMASLLAADTQAGRVFSNLYPFRESFYERLGYASLPLPLIAHISPPNLAPLLDMDHPGQVELLLSGQAFAPYREFLTRLRPRVHGMSIFDFGDPLIAQQNGLWVAFARVDGEIEGVMTYKLQGEDVTKFNFNVYRFYYLTTRARNLLLDWIARHIDQADRAELWIAPFEHPETWLTDLQVKIESQDRAPMSRILNIAGLGGMQTGAGDFSARVIDPLCPANNGAWNFESVGGRLRVSKTGRADCELSIQGLTALVFGTLDPQEFAFRGWGSPAPEVQAAMRAVFPPLTPYLHETF